MQGSIRMLLGFIVVLGGVGGMDTVATGEILTPSLAIAVVGLLVMWSGCYAMNKQVGSK